MSETTNHMPVIEEEVPLAPQKPRFFHETILILAGLAFTVMASGIYYYGLHGREFTAGLDRACAEAAFESGKQFEAMHNYEQALQRFRQAMDGHFNDPERRYMCGRSIGDILMREGRYSEAIEVYEDPEKLPEESYSFAGAYTGYVTSLWRDGQLEKALIEGKKWLKLAEAEQNPEQLRWANQMLMKICEDLGKTEEAKAYRTEVARLRAAQKNP